MDVGDERSDLQLLQLAQRDEYSPAVLQLAQMHHT
jgi:hypothetical protein